jgi:hypothetical protein
MSAAAAAHRRGDLLPQPLLDHRLPRHQAELAHAVIEHRVAPAGEHDAAPVDAGHALPVGHRAMLQAGFAAMSFAACASSRLRSVPSRLRARITRCPRRSASPCSARKSARCCIACLGLAAKAQVAQARAAADQLLVEPGGPDHAGLPLDGQVRFQLHGHAAQALRVVLAARSGRSSGTFHSPFGHALHDAGPAQGFEPADVGRDDFLRITAGRGLTLRDGQVVIGAVQAIARQRGDVRSAARTSADPFTSTTAPVG